MAKKKKSMPKKHKVSKKPDMHMEEEIHVEIPHAKKVHKKLPVSQKAQEKMETVLSEFKHGELHSGSKKGPKVKNRKQAVAIALHESDRYSKKNKKSKG